MALRDTGTVAPARPGGRPSYDSTYPKASTEAGSRVLAARGWGRAGQGGPAPGDSLSPPGDGNVLELTVVGWLLNIGNVLNAMGRYTSRWVVPCCGDFTFRKPTRQHQWGETSGGQQAGHGAPGDRSGGRVTERLSWDRVGGSCSGNLPGTHGTSPASLGSSGRLPQGHTQGTEQCQIPVCRALPAPTGPEAGSLSLTAWQRHDTRQDT